MPKQNGKTVPYLYAALLVVVLGWCFMLSVRVGDAVASARVNEARLDAYHEDIKVIKADVKQILRDLP